jgi:alkylhydroperoxidase family enzyme
MARVPYVNADDPQADPAAVAVLRSLEDAGQEILNVHRAMANHPEMMARLLDMAGPSYFDGSLDARLRELPHLTSAVATESFSSTPTHVVLGRSAELTDEEIAHLLDGPLPDGMYTPAEQAIIRYARASARMEPITDEMWDGLRRHFSIQAIIELGFIVGLQQLTTRFHRLVLTDADVDATNGRP